MTRFLILGVFLIVSGLSYSQAATKETKFTTRLQGTITKFSGNKIYLHHRWNEENRTDSVRVENGKFTVSVKSAEPNLYWFTLIADPNAQPNYPFFIDKEPLTARLKGDSIAFSIVDGGPAQKDYLEYRTMINNFVEVQQRMQNDFNQAAQRGDMATQEAIRAEYSNLNNQYLLGVKNFIKSHPKSVVSGYIIYSDLNNPAIPLAEVEDALNSIDKSITSTKFVQLANKRIDDLRGTTVGYKATDFSQNDPAGKSVKLSDFRGKYVLLDFWASWCRPCRMENPNVVAAFNRYKDKGFTVLGVSLDQKREPWLAAISADNLTWTHVSDLKGWGNEVGRLYGVTGIPQNFLIDRDGKIIAKDLRGAVLDQKLAEVFGSEKTIR